MEEESDEESSEDEEQEEFGSSTEGNITDESDEDEPILQANVSTADVPRTRSGRQVHQNRNEDYVY